MDRLILLENGLPLFQPTAKRREAMIHHAAKILPVLAIVVAFLSIGLRTHPDIDDSQCRLSVRTNIIGSAYAEFSEKEKGTIWESWRIS